jgi:phosphoserine aminotransferase
MRHVVQHHDKSRRRSRYGLIYAACKKYGAAGMAVVILNKKLAGQRAGCTPTLMSYQTMIDTDSCTIRHPLLYNYMLGLVSNAGNAGGIGHGENQDRKAKLLYDFSMRARCSRLRSKDARVGHERHVPTGARSSTPFRQGIVECGLQT